MKHFFNLLLMICSINGFCQNFAQKPYLEMQTIANSTPKVYRLKASNKLWLKTATDSMLIKDKIIGFTKDSAIMLKKHGRIGLNEIETISFKPIKSSRTVKQVIYLTGATIDLLLFSSAALQPLESDPTPIMFAVVLNSVCTIILAEGLGGLTYASEKKLALTQKTTRFSIRYR